MTPNGGGGKLEIDVDRSKKAILNNSAAGPTAKRIGAAEATIAIMASFGSRHTHAGFSTRDPKNRMTAGQQATIKIPCTLLTTPSVHSSAAIPMMTGRKDDARDRAAISSKSNPRISRPPDKSSVRMIRA